MVPADVLAANGGPQIHHKSAQFSLIYREVTDSLSYVYQTASDPLIFTSSGTGLMEGTVANLFKRGDRVAIVVSGIFGERWARIADAYGLEHVIYELPYGETTDPDDFRKWLGNQGKIAGLLLTHSETSTGTFHDVRAIAEKVADLEPLIVVDAVSSMGALELKTDQWGLDAVVSGSQKALMCPPGISFVALSERSWKSIDKSDLPRFYFDFRANRDALESSGKPRFTCATSVVIALSVALKRIREEGIEAIVKRHERLAAATQAGVTSLGLRLFSKAPSNAVTAVVGPEKIDVEKMRTILREEHGLLVAGGQGKMSGKIFRIGHMGYFDKYDVGTVLSALDTVLAEMGYPLEKGRSVMAAMEAYDV